MTAKYTQESRKRKQESLGGRPPKELRTAAERARCYRTRKAAAGNTSAASADWDAGEGPSTRGRRF